MSIISLRSIFSKLGLRDGWKQTLQLLASQSVPTFVFSAGFGDVVANAFLQGGLISEPTPGTVSSTSMVSLPQNIRIISNFFRAGPDGTVRAFSSPIVHDW